MSNVSVVVESKVVRTFRVDQVAGMFDVPLAKKTRREWEVDLPDESEPWKIGAIVGPSGSGKSVIARAHYGSNFVERFDWPADKAIVDAFAEGVSIREITTMLSAVGFSSPPDWIKPYGVLSNGQKFRADLARALISPVEVVAFDEFSSVVDRQVAKFGSAAVAKAVRRDGGKRFVAVTCHYDVLDWLQPDWVLDLGVGASGRLARGWLRRERKSFQRSVRARPTVVIDVTAADHSLWPVFAHHHYLSGRLHRAACCYVASWVGAPVAFCATLTNAGHAGRRLIHRLVVLPDYQGMGIGLRLLDFVAETESLSHVVSIRTSHPSLIAALGHRKVWLCTGLLQSGPLHRTFGAQGSAGRSTASFRFVGAA